MSKSQWIFTKFDMYFDIVRSVLGLLIGKFLFFDSVICRRHDNGGVLWVHILFKHIFEKEYETVFIFFLFIYLSIYLFVASVCFLLWCFFIPHIVVLFFP